MIDSNITRLNLTEPISPEMNLYMYWQEISGQVDELQMEILEYLVASGTSRGWFPEMANVVTRLEESAESDAVHNALRSLQEKRLLYLTPDGSIDSIVGGITHQKTAIRAMTSDKIPFYLLSAIDALSVAPTIQKAVSITAQCGTTGSEIRLAVDAQGHITEATPSEFTAFVPGWDGIASIPETMMNGGHFFETGEQMHQWLSEHGEPDGLPLTQDTIRSVGMEMARALAAIYTRISIR